MTERDAEPTGRVTIRGPGVTLRPFRRGEFETVWAADLRDGNLRPPVPADDLGIRAARLRDRLASSGTLTEQELLLAIEADGRLVGEVQARRADRFVPLGVYELGIEIYEEADRGGGLGREAVSLLAAHLFDQVGAHRIQATTDVDNAAMRKVLEGMGFPFEGVLRGFMPTQDGPRDYAMYGLTKDDYGNVKERWISPG